MPEATKLDVISLGDYYASVKEDENLADLSQEVNTVCKQRLRRIDRFTKLCLLGSAYCLGEHNFDARTGLYIGSRFASITNAVAAQNQMFQLGQIPKPASFINTLSNSAGYYVARNLGLQGKNIFVSRADASLEAVLQLVHIDLLSQQIDQALVGIVDEAIKPLSQHCKRMGIPNNTPLGEGSHWFLLSQSSTKKLATINEVRVFNSIENLKSWLKVKQLERTDIALHCKQALMQRLDAANMQPYQLTQPLNHYPSRTAGALLRFIQAQQSGALITIQHDDADRYHATYSIV